MIDAKNRTKLIDYVNEFYDIINDDKMVKKEFIEKCATEIQGIITIPEEEESKPEESKKD